MSFLKKPGDEGTSKPLSSKPLEANQRSLQQNETLNNESTGPFRPYEPKKNEFLAHPVPQSVKENFSMGCFDSLFEGQYESEELYLKEIKTRTPFRTKRGPLFIRKDTSGDPDIEVVDSKSTSKTKSAYKTNSLVMKFKLIKFAENVRFPYFGTHSKQSKVISGRRPFALDNHWLNYEVDSDEEWEEGGPGESLKGSDDEADPEDDYEIDNDFMVPHGYLSGSEEEHAREEETDVKMGEDGNFREKEMISRKNMKVRRLKPIGIGCLWGNQFKQQENAVSCHILSKYKMVVNGPIDMTMPRIPEKKEPRKRIRKKKVSTDEEKRSEEQTKGSQEED